MQPRGGVSFFGAFFHSLSFFFFWGTFFRLSAPLLPSCGWLAHGSATEWTPEASGNPSGGHWFPMETTIIFEKVCYFNFFACSRHFDKSTRTCRARQVSGPCGIDSARSKTTIPRFLALEDTSMGTWGGRKLTTRWSGQFLEKDDQKGVCEGIAFKMTPP